MGNSIKRLRSIYNGMKQRCYNPNNPMYEDYGGRGIKIDEGWKENFDIFVQWAFTHGYSEKLSIDRKDVNGNYEPENCRWSDDITQANNKRNSVNEEQRKRKLSENNVSKVMSFRLRNKNARYIEEKAKERDISRSKLADEIVETYTNIETLCMWSDIEPTELARQLDILFRNGDLIVRDGKLECRSQKNP